MYGLPFQTEDDVVNTAELAASLAPSRLALFGYAHAPWFKRQQLIDAAALPGAAERLRQAATAGDAGTSEAMSPIGLDHFALPDDPMALALRAGSLRRNFQGYTVDQADALLAFGASSIGRLPQGYVQNAADVGTWRRAIEAGRLPWPRAPPSRATISPRAAMIERLMCDFSVDLDAEAGATEFPAELDAVDTLAGSGIVSRHGRQVVVTEKGRPFVRLVAAAFDAYLPQHHKRHSVAV